MSVRSGGPASETLSTLIATGNENGFDFAFIDADKANYLDYYEKTLALVRPGGLIVIDNVLRSGDVLDPQSDDPGTQAVLRLNDLLADDPRVDLSMLPVGDGLTLARKGATLPPARPARPVAEAPALTRTPG